MNNNQKIENEDIYFIKECLTGNIGIFAKLVEKYKDMVYNLTYSVSENSIYSSFNEKLLR